MFLQRFLLSLFFFYILSSSAMAAQATFSWLPNSESHLAGYKVYYGSSPRNYTTVIDVGLPDPVNGRIQTVVDNLTEGMTYYFAATAYDGQGQESAYSEEVLHTIPVPDTILAPQPAGQKDFSWLPNTEANLAGYKVHYGTASRTYTEALDIGLPDPIDGRIHGTVTGLTIGKTYYFAATAYDIYGNESDYSDEAVYTIPAGETLTQIFGSTPDADYPGTVADTFTNINDQVLDGSDTLSTWSWSSPSPHKVANTILLKTDLSALPSTANIIEARLYLYQTGSYGESRYSNTVHQITGHDPVISEVSGVNAAAGIAWNSVSGGITHNDTPLGLADIAQAEDTVLLDTGNGYRSWRITSMVRGWVADPASNFGLLIKGQSGMASETGRLFAASENSNAAIRPKLVVTYSTSSSTILPTAADSTVNGQEDTSLKGSLEVTNSGGLSLQYAVTTAPVHGSVRVDNSTGQFTYTPHPDFNGMDGFSFTAANENGVSNTATVTIIVQAVNDKPTAQNAYFTTNEDTPLSGTLSGADADGNALHYTLLTQPGTGTVNINPEGSFSYTPAENWSGSEKFTYKVNDGTVDSNTATVTVTVNPVNDSPAALAASLTTNEDSPINGQLKATDADQDILKYTLVSGPANGTVIFKADGTFTYTPTENWSGSDRFSFKVNDGIRDSNIAAVTLTVKPVNDAPVADNQSISVHPGGTISGFLTAGDQEGDSLSFAVVSPPAQGKISVNRDGTFSYTAKQDATGADSFRFTADDGNSTSAVATVTITIDPATPDFRFELTEIQADSSWQSVSFDSPFNNPVVIARASSFNNNETGVVRVKNVDKNGLELRFQEWDSLDDRHPAETITLMVVEAGTFTLDNGVMVEAGCFPTSGASKFSWRSFQQPMSVPPVVMTAVNTANEDDAVTTRIRNINTVGFDFMMSEQEKNRAAHGQETACYLAWEPSAGKLGSMQYEVAVTDDRIKNSSYAIKYDSQFIELPMILAAMQTTDGPDTAVLRINSNTIEGMNVFVREEQSRDAETSHTTERGGYISIASYDPAGDPDGDTLTTDDEENIYFTHPGLADTDYDGIDDGAEVAYWQEQGSSWDEDIDQDGLINILDPDADGDGIVDGSEVAAGFPNIEGGEVDVNNNWVHVDLSGSFVKPVVIARLVSQNGSDPCVVRVNNVSTTGFDLRLEEYEYLDGWHAREQVSYLVMEAGTYTLADGTLVEAGMFTTKATSTYSYKRFEQNFSRVPVVISTVSTSNEADTVTTRIRNIKTNGFEYKLQEQEANARSHRPESLAYIAWEPSNGSENGIRYQVGRSEDNIKNAPKTLSYADRFNSPPLLYTGMQTADGGDTAMLRTISNSAAGFQVLVEEEKSRDSEVAHTTEVAGFISILPE